MCHIEKIRDLNQLTALEILQLPERDILYILMLYSGISKQEAREKTNNLISKYYNLSNILSAPVEDIYQSIGNRETTLLLSVAFACVRKIFWENCL